jgi:hypothetical protein
MRTSTLASSEPAAKVLAFVRPEDDLSDDETTSLRLGVQAQVRRVIAYLVAHPEAWDASPVELAALGEEAGRCA